MAAQHGPKRVPKPGATSATTRGTVPAVAAVDLESAMTMLERRRRTAALDAMVRYGIPSHNAIGVTMSGLKAIARVIGRKDHDAAAAPWTTGV